ncbi:hypothetical protein ACH5RR_007739 [Cinchona calisaya]|uniref:Fucosyltransferase n=1 Tax=Cinchona calisaya TaxID=153742 RepID=A0ABD3A9N5_9GENT
MTKLMRNSGSDQTKPHQGPQNYTVLKCPPKAKCSGNPIKLSGILFCCLMGFFVLFSVFKNPSSSSDSFWLLDFNPFRKDAASGNTTKPQPTEVPQDKLLGGLLLAGLDEKSCLSRYQSILYRKRRTGHPSSHLISRLRSYEALHKRCGPYTESYNRTMDNYLKTGQVSNSTESYLWILAATYLIFFASHFPRFHGYFPLISQYLISCSTALIENLLRVMAIWLRTTI